jgi:ribulose-5-phosphate 4-epimerase/fuculose-1-phosphate aldolase
VLHTHIPHATALAVTGDGLQTRSSQAAMLFHRGVARLPFAGLAKADDEADRFAAGVGEGNSVVLFDNHGVLVVGSSVPDAWHKLYFLERACQIQVLARSTGSRMIFVPENVAIQTERRWRSIPGAADSLCAAERRAVDRLDPGWEHRGGPS